MARVDPAWVLAADSTVQTLAAVLGLVLAWRTLRRRGLHNPLRQCAVPPRGLGLLEAGLILCGYLVVAGMAYQLAGVRPQDVQQPGSAGWNRAVLADHIVKLALSLVMIVLLRWDGYGALGFRGWRGLVAGAVAGLIALPLCFVQLQACQVLWNWLWPQRPPPVHDALAAIGHNAWGTPGVAMVAVGAALIAPLSEELFFRGMLLQALWRRTGGPWLAIILSALLFASIHVAVPQTILPLLTLGLILGYVRVRYRSLAACVLAHALFNARTIAIALLNPQMVM